MLPLPATLTSHMQRTSNALGPWQAVLRAGLIAAVSGAIAACSVASGPRATNATTSANASADVAAIRAARADQNRAIAEGDLPRVAQYWTEDVSARRGLGAPIAGKAAYLEIVQPKAGAMNSVIYERTPTDVDVSAPWPLAFETGTWAGRLGSANGPQIIAGRYSAQWVKRDGRWLIRSEVFVALSCRESGCDSHATP